MDKIKRFCIFTSLTALLATSLFAAESGLKENPSDIDVLIHTGLPRFEFTTYAGIGSGSIFAGNDATILLESNSGFQLTPSFAIGVFYGASPLSNFEHASLSINIADTEAAYAVQSGTEILFTPFAERVVHPLIRASIGGTSIGYLQNIDDEEGYDAAIENRYFQASLSAGAELNLTRHIRMALRGGYHFIGNDETLGIKKNAMSGPEIALSLRVLWKTVID